MAVVAAVESDGEDVVVAMREPVGGTFEAKSPHIFAHRFTGQSAEDPMKMERRGVNLRCEVAERNVLTQPLFEQALGVLDPLLPVEFGVRCHGVNYRRIASRRLIALANLDGSAAAFEAARVSMRGPAEPALPAPRSGFPARILRAAFCRPEFSSGMGLGLNRLAALTGVCVDSRRSTWA